MSLPIYLSQLKSAGLYRYVFDKSQIPVEERDSIRLFIGYSEKGPFNTLVYVESPQMFINYFGGVSRRMERKGIFFHRLCLQALEAGPILALNLKPFNLHGKTETANIIGFNTNELIGDGQNLHIPEDALVAATSKGMRDVTLSTIYDTNRFWHVDSERLHDIRMGANSASNGAADLIRIARVSDSKDDCTIFMRPVVPANWHVKVSDWYSSNQSYPMPPYMEYLKDHYLDEFFMEIYVFRGNLAKKSLFDHTGTLGACIPVQFIYDTYDTVDGDHQVGDTKYYPNTDRPVLKEVRAYENGNYTTYAIADWQQKIGTNITNPSSDNERELSWVPFCIVDDADGKVYTNPKYVNAYGELADPLVDMADVSTSNYVASYVGITIPGFRDGLGSFVSIDHLFNADSDIHGMLANIDESKLEAAADLDSDGSGFYSSSDEYSKGNESSTQQFSVLAANGGAHTHSDLIWTGLDANHKFTPAQFLVALLSGTMGLVATVSQTNAQLVQDAETKVKEAKLAFDKSLAAVKVAENAVKKGSGNEAGIKTAQETAKAKEAAYNAALAALEKAKRDSGTGIEINDYAQTSFKYSLSNGGEKEFVVARKVVGTPMHGYQYTSIARNASGPSLQADIFSALSYKGIRQALSNNVDCDYHYLVDTFQTYPGIGMKSLMSQIVKAKDNAILITSFPSMESVMRHCGHTAYTGGFDMKEVAKATNGITLPTEAQGASWTAFYTQLKMTDGSTKFIAPSTALVSNLFMEKLQKRHAYNIVAGVNYGLIKHDGVVGPDYNYDRADKDVLEPFGVNVITLVPRYGTSIQGNQTAKQTPRTALSKLHVRELVIYLQDEIEKMLRGYQWENNTSVLRDNILAKAEVILGLAKANGGIYEYRAKCDSDNNTPEIIDNEMVVLDVEVEPTRGAEKMVQTLTIHRTGGISSSPAN